MRLPLCKCIAMRPLLPHESNMVHELINKHPIGNCKTVAVWESQKLSSGSILARKETRLLNHHNNDDLHEEDAFGKYSTNLDSIFYIR